MAAKRFHSNTRFCFLFPKVHLFANPTPKRRTECTSLQETEEPPRCENFSIRPTNLNRRRRNVNMHFAYTTFCYLRFLGVHCVCVCCVFYNKSRTKLAGVVFYGHDLSRTEGERRNETLWLHDFGLENQNLLRTQEMH